MSNKGSRSGMQREVSPVVAILAGIGVLALVGGIWWVKESRQAAEMAQPGNRAENVRKALQNPETVNKLRAMSQGTANAGAPGGQ